MASKKIGLQFDGWEDYMAKLDEVGHSSAVERGVEAGLKASKQFVNPKIEKSITGSNLPAGGRYSAPPHVKDSLNRDFKVVWEGKIAELKIGFDLNKGAGLTSIFLMCGTPRMRPAKGLKAAIYGAKTKKEVAEIQEESIGKVIKRIMEG